MLSAYGVVKTDSAGSMTLAVDPPASCHGCGAACALAPVIGLLQGTATRSVTVPQAPGMRCGSGSRVQVTISARRLAGLAALAYGLPLAALIASAGTAAALMPAGGDPVAAAGACAGLGLAWRWLAAGSLRRFVAGSLRADAVDHR